MVSAAPGGPPGARSRPGPGRAARSRCRRPGPASAVPLPPLDQQPRPDARGVRRVAHPAVPALAAVAGGGASDRRVGRTGGRRADRRRGRRSSRRVRRGSVPDRPGSMPPATREVSHADRTPVRSRRVARSLHRRVATGLQVVHEVRLLCDASVTYVAPSSSDALSVASPLTPSVRKDPCARTSRQPPRARAPRCPRHSPPRWPSSACPRFAAAAPPTTPVHLRDPLRQRRHRHRRVRRGAAPRRHVVQPAGRRPLQRQRRRVATTPAPLPRSPRRPARRRGGRRARRRHPERRRPTGWPWSAGGRCAEFLSYEGTFTAADGPRPGMTSTDIGVASRAPSAGQSLSRALRPGHGRAACGRPRAAHRGGQPAAPRAAARRPRATTPRPTRSAPSRAPAPPPRWSASRSPYAAWSSATFPASAASTCRTPTVTATPPPPTASSWPVRSRWSSATRSR